MSGYIKTAAILLTDLTTGQPVGFLGGDGREYPVNFGGVSVPPSRQGDQSFFGTDPSPWRRGFWTTASGGIYTLVGDIVMMYESHNVPLDSATGNFLGRDDTGPCQLFVYTEGLTGGPILLARYDAVSAAAGTVPVWTLGKVEGSSCDQVVNNNAGATVTLGTGQNYIGCTGTNATSVQFVLPPVANLTDGFTVTIFTQAAISVASTFTSTGGTFLNAPATMAAGAVVRFKKNGTNWLPC